MATALEARRHLDLGEGEFRRLFERGVIKSRPPPEGYDLNEVRREYLRHLHRRVVLSTVRRVKRHPELTLWRHEELTHLWRSKPRASAPSGSAVTA
jgi:hypothetical protein